MEKRMAKNFADRDARMDQDDVDFKEYKSQVKAVFTQKETHLKKHDDEIHRIYNELK